MFYRITTIHRRGKAVYRVRQARPKGQPAWDGAYFYDIGRAVRFVTALNQHLSNQLALEAGRAQP